MRSRPKTLRPIAVAELAKYKKVIGRNIHDRRVVAKMSKVMLQAKCGVARHILTGIENGTRNIGFLNLLKIATALGVTPTDLLGKSFE